MRHDYKLSQYWSSQDGMVRGFEVNYFELDILCPEVLNHSKCEWECNRANWCRGVSWNDAVEASFAWCKQTHIAKAHLHQCACKDQVEPASTINKYSSGLGSLDDRVEY